MTEQGWRTLAIRAVDDATNGDPTALDLLAKLLAEQDAAKEALRREGFGVIGTPWPEVVREVQVP